MKSNQLHAVNKVTGLFYELGEGFSQPCKAKATPLTLGAFAMVRYTFNNVIAAPDTDCACEDCVAAADWEGVTA